MLRVPLGGRSLLARGADLIHQRLGAAVAGDERDERDARATREHDDKAYNRAQKWTFDQEKRKLAKEAEERIKADEAKKAAAERAKAEANSPTTTQDAADGDSDDEGGGGAKQDGKKRASTVTTRRASSSLTCA